MRKIAVFGSAFNPPHAGHADAVIQALEVFDTAYISPSASHPQKSNLLDYQLRILMIRNWARDFGIPEEAVVISTAEAHLARLTPDRPVYTYDLMHYLESSLGVEPVLIIGKDNAEPSQWSSFYRHKDIDKRWDKFVVKENCPTRSSLIRKSLSSLDDNAEIAGYKELLIRHVGRLNAEFILRNELYRELETA